MLHAPLRRLRFVSCGMDVPNFKTSQDLPSPQLMNCYFFKFLFLFLIHSYFTHPHIYRKNADRSSGRNSSTHVPRGPHASTSFLGVLSTALR